MIDYSIRDLKPTEFYLLSDFLYEAIFIPIGVQPPPRDIINLPELQVYINKFGAQKSDMALVAEVNSKIVGVVWVRIMDDYGHIDDNTPSFAISLLQEYRGLGIGTQLMISMLSKLVKNGYKQASLAVQKKNYAVKMYQKVGFKIVDENSQEYIMLCDLNNLPF